MPLVVTKETGSGSASANSYAAVADGDAYFDGHLYATAWTGADEATKGAALVMATRLIDSQFQFNGRRATEAQALQWPRTGCPDPDRGGGTLVLRGAECVEEDEVPPAVVSATCEMGRELLILDRTTAPPGEGIAMQHNTDYSETQYSKSDTRRILSHVARAMLSKFGVEVSDRGGPVSLERV